MIIIVLIGLLLLLLIYLVIYRQNSESDTHPEVRRFSADLIKDPPKTKPPVSESKPISPMVKQESLDTIYAKEHGMWICPFCESMNSSSEHLCAACGKKR